MQRVKTSHRTWRLLGAIFAASFLAVPGVAQAGGELRTDVVVIVDTSTSMRKIGMDPERTSLLVTQLLADIVPGEMAAIRLLDLVADRNVLASKETGLTEPCAEDPTRNCGIVAPASDWEDDARTQQLGVLVRPARRDESYAAALDGHLDQVINNSMFVLAFRAAEGLFEKHLAAGLDLPRTVIWLSDGTSDEPERVVGLLRRLDELEVGVEAIVFGQGTTKLAERAGLEARRAAGPAELMRSFAGAFRGIVEAPYEIDARISEHPSFVIQPAVEEAWVVVYGDDGLGKVHVETPDGEHRSADYAARRLAGAGAYRVAHFAKPAAGRYTVAAEGGGANVAYAVVQRSSLRPRLVEPSEALSNTDTTLVVEIVAGDAGTAVSDAALLADASVTVTSSELGTLTLDRRKDGRFEGVGRFRSSGEATLEIHLSSPVVKSRIREILPVTGSFNPRRGEVEIDLGSLGLGDESCRQLETGADHQGEVPLLALGLRRPPAEHRIYLRLAGQGEPWLPGEQRRVSPSQRLEVCLQAGDRAPSSSAEGHPGLTLGVPGAGEQLTLLLSWQVEGLGFWARWGWLVLTVVSILLLIVVIVGFIVPYRFSPSLALVFVDDRDEIDEQQPQPIRQWKGVGIGFYRHARAHLHNSFRISGKARGALATLVAQRRGALVMPGKGAALCRETLDAEWQPVAAEGRRMRGGEVYRVGESGPYFRVAVRGGRDG